MQFIGLISSLHISRASDAPEADVNVLAIDPRAISSFEMFAENRFNNQYVNILMRPINMKRCPSLFSHANWEILIGPK